MKRIIKSSLLISTAFLVWPGYMNSSLAMNTAQGGAMQRGGMPGQGMPKSAVTDACNQCVLAIEDLVKKKVLTQEVIEKISQESGNQEEKIQEFLEPYMSTAKESVLKHISTSLEEEFTYLDQPVPNEQKVIEIINKSCDYIKTHVDEMIEAVKSALQGGTIRGKSSTHPETEEKSEGGGFGGVRLKKSSHPPSMKSSNTPSTPSFTIQLKSRSHQAKQDTRSEAEIAEEKVREGLSDHDKLQTIKDFLATKKGPQFASGFADEELLAFPLWTFDDLVSTDLENLSEGFEVRHLKGRKFSLKVLGVLKGIRFNKHESEHTKSMLLTSKEVKTNTPKWLLGNILGVSAGIMQQLISDGDIK